jgi:hypothetical protein
MSFRKDSLKNNNKLSKVKINRITKNKLQQWSNKLKEKNKLLKAWNRNKNFWNN